MNYFEVTGRGALHIHPDADHRLYVLEGSLLVTCGATTSKCTVGDFIIIPRGVPIATMSRHRAKKPCCSPSMRRPMTPKKPSTLSPSLRQNSRRIDTDISRCHLLATPPLYTLTNRNGMLRSLLS
ncbi:MAG: hypothetical protein JWL59_284 [Chthoniobacteraceae bacterium]|nr:hypothetical protein [Chthoniobacteraceae bacterium]